MVFQRQSLGTEEGGVNQIREFFRSNRVFFGLLLAFGLVRTAVADYNPVPSSSMHPTILEGDVILVDRLAYNLKVPLTGLVVARLGEPKRGDIATFSSPLDGKRLVKRIIGLPGDVISMKGERLQINGQPVEYSIVARDTDVFGEGFRLPVLRVREELGEHSYAVQWLNGGGRAANFAPLSIPPDRYLVLGDNRDNSADSRYIGLVPRELLIGRASRVLVSAAINDNWSPRFDRFGMSLYQ
jgi:signal peptidase I